MTPSHILFVNMSNAMAVMCSLPRYGYHIPVSGCLYNYES
jgi:hypothetical protein